MPRPEAAGLSVDPILAVEHPLAPQVVITRERRRQSPHQWHLPGGPLGPGDEPLPLAIPSGDGLASNHLSLGTSLLGGTS